MQNYYNDFKVMNKHQTEADILRKQFETIQMKRRGIEYLWDIVLRLVQPNYNLHNFFNKISEGKNVTDWGQLNVLRQLYHNRGAVNSAVLASYLHANLTNPHSDWMKITIPEIYTLQGGTLTDEQINELKDLQLISQESHTLWQSSNLHSTLYGFYKTLIDLGTACLVKYHIGNSKNSQMVFVNMSMFNVFFEEDIFARPNVIFCIYNWSAYQIKKFFHSQVSDNMLYRVMPEDVLKCYLNNDFKSFPIVHYVVPNDDYEGKWKSCYFYAVSKDEKSKDFIASHTIDQNPYTICRIRKNPESVYGTGFSMEAYPLLASLQTMQDNCWLASDKNVNPPMNTPTNRTQSLFSTAPNTLNPMDDVAGKPVGIAPSLPPINIQHLMQNKEALLQDIDKTYMIDKIIMESVKHNRSATEVEKRTGEEIKILSPFIGSLENEFLRPLVESTLDFFFTKRKKSEVYQALRRLAGQNFNLQYISPIAQIQLRGQINQMLEFIGITNMLADKDKSVIMRQNILSLWEKIAILMNHPMDTVNMKRELDQGMQQLRQSAENEQKVKSMESMKGAGTAYKDIMQGESIRRNINIAS